MNEERMAEQDSPKLDLGEPPGTLKRKLQGVSRKWLVCLLLLQAATLAYLVMLSSRTDSDSGSLTVTAPDRVGEMRRIAQELEDKSLSAQAARAWNDYLDVAPGDAERAAILYRVGRLYMEADEYDNAAAAFVRCEQAAGDGDDFQTKIGPHMVTCLRRLGLYGEVGRELSRRTEIDGAETGKGQVLATIAGEPLTEADRDRMIERRVDQMLSMQGASGDEAQRQQVLRQFAAPQIREQLFQEMLQDSLFTRRAREVKLDQDTEFQDALAAMESSLLANRFLRQELAKLTPTDVDLKSYFQANEKQYELPESLEAVVVAAADGEDIDAVLKSINSAEDFKKLARERLPEDQKKQETLPAEQIVKGRFHPRLGNTDKLFELSVDEWTKQPHQHAEKRYLVLIAGKKPASVPGFAEVRARVNADYLSKKRQERIQQLFQDLMARYSVRIMPPKKDGQGNGQDAGQSASETSKTSKKSEEDSP